MEKSAHTTPRVFSLVRMMSHPGSPVKQFIHSTSEILLDDGVEMVLNCQFPYCSWMVSHPGHGTKIARGWDGTKVISVSLYLSKTRNLVPRDVTAPEVARGVPLPVYMNF